MPDTTVTAEVVIPHVGLPALEAANFFFFSASGPEIVMLVGMVDTNAMAIATQKAGGKFGGAGGAKVSAQISHRFFMSVRGFVQLHQNVNEIMGELVKSGVISPSVAQPNVKKS